MKANKMSNKMFFAVMGLVTIVAISLIAVVAVIAASTQIVTSNINVSYHANNVAATVSASYQKAGDNSVTTMVNGDRDNIRFYATQATTSGNLTTPNNENLVLTSQNPYVVFLYTFTNNATRDLENNIQGYDVRITLTDNSTRNHIVAHYMTDTTTPSGTLTSKYETLHSASTTVPSSVYVGAQNSVYFYILLEVDDVDYDASYSSTTSAGLSWALAHVDYLDGDWVNYGWTINENNVVTAYNGTDTDIIIPSTATKINDNLFQNNTKITSVTIPNTITRVGDYAFQGCTKLKSVVFENSSSTTSNSADGIINNDQSSLGYSASTTIGAYAFYRCTKLSNLTLSDNIISIGETAFQSCNNISTITIPNSVVSIGSYAFRDLIKLSTITIPSSVTAIGTGIFDDCRGLTIITVDGNNSVYYSQNNCIIRKSDKKLIQGCRKSIIPNDVTSIEAYAFTGCVPTTSITIPNAVTSIGIYAFYGCSGITSLTIPSSVTSIGDSAFQNCPYLANVYFEHSNINTITKLGKDAFTNQKSGVAYYFKDTEENVASWGKFTTDYFDNTTYHSY